MASRAVAETEAAVAAFAQRFGRVPTVIASAGGRVNVIGEHTDYHEGYALPAAIDLRTLALAAPRDDGALCIRSDAVDAQVTVSVAQLTAPPTTIDWRAYALGPFWALGRTGATLPGADVLIRSAVPLGGGLSSSASLQVALAGLAAHLGGRALCPVELAALARSAERDYCGVPCGPMDQIASACGERGCALRLDCRTLEARPVRFPARWALAVVDSGVRHALASSEYAVRQRECAEALAVIRRISPELRAARDLQPEVLEQARPLLAPRLHARLRHVVSENSRVLAACAALEREDAAALGELLQASHESLRRDYEVSCAELDALVEAALATPGVFGARLTGAGFGGNTVSLVAADRAAEIAAAIAEGYARSTGRRTEAHVVHPAEGLSVTPL